jgi:hypothetical protein
LALAVCCGPLHRGEKEAETPVALMRSRYAAFAVANVDYLWRTLHEEHSDRTLDRAEVLSSLRRVCRASRHPGLMVLDDGGRIARFLRLDRALRVKVCPVVLSAPWGVTVGFPPPYVPMPTRIYMEFLPAIRFDRSGPDAADDEAYVEACHQQVATAMQSALSRLSAERARDKRARHLSALDATAARLRLQPAWRDALEELAILSGVTPNLGVD